MSDRLRIARQIVMARRTNRAILKYPGTPPQTLVEAYAVQQVATDLMREPVVGWKIAAIPPELREVLGEARTIGPIFASSVTSVGSGLNRFPCINGGYAAFEAELIVTIAADLDVSRLEFAKDYILGLIGEVHYGVEIAGSPFADLPAAGPLVSIASFGSNLGLCLCEPLVNWKESELCQQSYRVTIDDKVVGEASLADRLVDQLAFACRMSAQLGSPLRKGDLISTGAVTGVHRVLPGQRVSFQIKANVTREHFFLTEALPQC